MSLEYSSLMRPWYERYTCVAEPAKLEVELSVVQSEARAALVEEAHACSTAQLRSELIGLILAQPPAFLEHLIVDLLYLMGYANRKRDLARCLGKSNDGGVDGVIDQDQLGLERIYLQAKRYRPNFPVPVAQVRDFIGALETHSASKGVMVTTSHFTRAALEAVSRVKHRVILIDNTRLSDLMIRYNVGVEVKRSYQFKAVDASYFPALAPSGVLAPGGFDLQRFLNATRRN